MGFESVAGRAAGPQQSTTRTSICPLRQHDDALIPLKDNVPTLRFPVVTVGLIVACVAVFIWQLSFSADTEFSSSFPGVSERDAAPSNTGRSPTG